MEWRCEWCGKPHEADDPPCDECGHHKFEKAVVPVAPSDPEHEREPVWVCPACGRQHQKNSPPCSRCGATTLEKRIPDETDYADELGGTSYRDVLDLRHVAGFALAVVAGSVLLLAVAGVVTLPGMGEDVPGSAASVHDVSLPETESAFVSELNERRDAAGFAALDRRDELDGAARAFNREFVRFAYGDAERPPRDEIRADVGGACGDAAVESVVFSRPPGDESDDAYDAPDALATSLVDLHELQQGTFFGTERDRVGVDVHAGPDDRVIVTVVAC